jgi:hypothetical protein
MSQGELPMGTTILTTAQIAKRLGPDWDSQRARRWLTRTGAGTKVGGRVITTPRRLAQHFPELWDELVLELPERSL